jgi:hypothetical protein
MPDAQLTPAPQEAKIIEAPPEPIILSPYTEALLQSVESLKPRAKPDELSKLIVSQTVTFLALAYEKVRNAIEYREDHLVLRAAIERILNRRLSMNGDGRGEAENLLRELMWARYYANGSLGEEDIEHIQKIINRYISIKKVIVTGRDGRSQKYLYEFLIELLTCEIEEALTPDIAYRNASFNYFLYQTLRKKVSIDNITPEQKDAFFLVALEKAYRKSDVPYERYHLFITFYQSLSQYTDEQVMSLATDLPQIFKKIDAMIKNSYVETLTRFVRKQLPPYLVLFDLLKKKGNTANQILTKKHELWQEVDMICREKYAQASSRLRVLAIKSLIYIFVTKMIFALILEYPISLWLYHEVNYTSIIINSVFPPILMLIIVLMSRLPGEDNTVRIYQRIIDIIDNDKSFETTKVMNLSKKMKVKKPILVFGFTIFYTMTFFITIFLIHEGLNMINFNLVSQTLFIFFVSVITFFSYRIKQVVNEYRLLVKESILTPIIDFFFMPILSLGKFFSTQIGRLNFFIVIFDFIIEAPFKLIIEVVEEWISYVRQRKEEIM